MLTNNQAIVRVKNYTDQDLVSFISGWSDEGIHNDLIKYRARILMQKHMQKLHINLSNYQDTPALELIEVPVNECEVELEEGCTLLRTKKLVPKSILPTYLRVYNPNNNKQYSHVSLNKLEHTRNSRYKSLNDSTSYHKKDTGAGEYVYLVTKNLDIEKIVISGLFERPLEVQTMLTCEGTRRFPCRSFYDYEFKLDEANFTTARQIFFAELYKLKYGPKDDVQDHRVNT